MSPPAEKARSPAAVATMRVTSGSAAQASSARRSSSTIPWVMALRACGRFQRDETRRPAPLAKDFSVPGHPLLRASWALRRRRASGVKSRFGFALPALPCCLIQSNVLEHHRITFECRGAAHEFKSHPLQPALSPREQARGAGRDHAARSRPTPAPQPQGRLVAPAGARARAFGERSSLAALPDRRHGGARAGRIDAGRRAHQRRRGGARSRARRKAAHPGARDLPQYRSLLARSARLGGAERQEPGLPRRARHQEGRAGDRDRHRRRARPLHEPRP